MTALLATAFVAGLVSTVNPCGFAMLPAYLGYFLGIDTDHDGTVRRALSTGAAVSAGFLVVFGITGVIVVAGVRSVTSAIPWLAVVIGAGLVLLGIHTLRGRYLNLRLPLPKRMRRGRDHGSIVLFGISYAIASLSCTLPIFLSLVATSFTQTSFARGLSAFLAYGAGMSLMLVGITVTLAVGKDGLVRRLRSASKAVSTVSGIVLVGAGLFIVWYWLTILSSGAIALGSTGPAAWVEQASSASITFISEHPVVVAGGLVLMVTIGVVAAWQRRRSAVTESDGVS